jgi:hypothetical protein
VGFVASGVALDVLACDVALGFVALGVALDVLACDVALGFVALGVALGVLACGFALGWAGRPLKICFVCPLLFAQGGGVECAFARC